VHNWNGVKKTKTLEAVALEFFTSYGWSFVVRFNLKFGRLSVLPNVCNNWFDSLHFKGMKPNFIYYLKKNCSEKERFVHTVDGTCFFAWLISLPTMREIIGLQISCWVTLMGTHTLWYVFMADSSV